MEPIKTETVTNITFHKITEKIESCKVLEVTDDEGVIQLLTGLKHTVVVAHTGFPIRTTPISTRILFLLNQGLNTR